MDPPHGWGVNGGQDFGVFHMIRMVVATCLWIVHIFFQNSPYWLLYITIFPLYCNLPAMLCECGNSARFGVTSLKGPSRESILCPER
jgi:hypothetical protein